MRISPALLHVDDRPAGKASSRCATIHVEPTRQWRGGAGAMVEDTAGTTACTRRD